MDPQRFDDLSRDVAASPSRRRVVKVLAGGMAVGLCGFLGVSAERWGRRQADRVTDTLHDVQTALPDDPSPMPTTSRGRPVSPPTPVPQTAWERVLGQISDDGRVGLETALHAFSLAIGPLPGVTVPNGEVGVIPSGSGAVRWLFAHWDELTPDQQAAATTMLQPAMPSATARRSAAAGGVRKLAAENAHLAQGILAAPADEERYRTAIRGMIRAIAGHLGRSLGIAWEVWPLARESHVVPAADAWTDAVNKDGGRTGAADHCRFVFEPHGQRLPAADLAVLIAHEVFHCFQAEIVGLDRYFSLEVSAPWILEGQAEWVGQEVAGPSSYATSGFWRDYLRRPERPLTARSYDAIGFYAHLKESRTGINPWTRLVPMLLAENSRAAFDAAIFGGENGFLDTWASGYFRAPSLGPDWDTTGMAITTDRATPIRLTVGNGAVKTVDTDPFALGLFELTTSADVVRIEIAGRTRLKDAAGIERVGVPPQDFCADGRGCKCPPGSSYRGPELPPLSASIQTNSRARLAITGGPDGAKGTVTGRSLAEFCQPTWKCTDDPELFFSCGGGCCPNFPPPVQFFCDGGQCCLRLPSVPVPGGRGVDIDLGCVPPS